MYQALYRKYRPRKFSEVVGQKAIIKTLSNSILNNKVSHAYLFTGPRGTGKTSTAKIFAQTVNCLNLKGVIPCDTCESCIQIINKQNTDIIEIDAASNNGVDEIRELRDKVNLVPSYGKYKIYIIDEVHMLTTAAFNALLKTLEEPPAHIIFILATTEPHKIPETILSRCQRYDFKKLSPDEIKDRLKHVSTQEKINISEEAINMISFLSDGGMRDALSLLDQLNSYCENKIEIEDVHEIYGTITNEQIYAFVNDLINCDLSNLSKLIQKYDNSGKNFKKIVELIIQFLKNCLIYYNDSMYFESEKEKQMFGEIIKKVTEEKIYSIIEIYLECLNNIKLNSNSKLLFELASLKALQINKNKETKEKDKMVVEEESLNSSIKQSPQINKISDSLKKIRINNTLARNSRKELNDFRLEISKLEILRSDINYGSITSLILDGELKAKGGTNLIYVYKTKKLEEYFNSSLKDIEKILNLIYNIDYKPIAVCLEEWEIIKNKYNMTKNKNDYIYVEEMKKIEKPKVLNEQNSSSNKIEELFDNEIIYN